MSRTKRNFLDGFHPKKIKEGGDRQSQLSGWLNSAKMKPYEKGRKELKFEATKTDHVGGYSKGISQYDKLITKNANRSRKKAYRQELKRELKEELNDV